MSLFDELAASLEPIVMESMCVGCEKNGKTTMLMTRIPFFKEVIVTSFRCEECGYRNSEVTFGGKIGDYGLTLEVTVNHIDDFRRDIVKSEFASLTIPEIGLEIPKGKGQISTIEGIIQKVIEDLENSQEDRKKIDPLGATQIDEFLGRLRALSEGRTLPFKFVIHDPAGNSYIKNPFLPKHDPNLKVTPFNRTREELEAMGFVQENAMKHSEEEKERDLSNITNITLFPDGKHEEEFKEKEQHKTEVKMEKKVSEDTYKLHNPQAHRLDLTKALPDDFKTEAMEFHVQCHACNEPAINKMCTLAIPYFKDLIIMSFVCDHCGAHDAEVKTGGEIPKLGKKLTIKVVSNEELKRDCFKSDSALVSIPEVGLELMPGTLGSLYTTVEGLVAKVIDNLKDNNPFVGDSDGDTKKKLEKFFQDMDDIMTLKKPFTLILDDPLADCFIQNPKHPEPDTGVIVEEYERTKEQNEELGITQLKEAEDAQKEQNNKP